jgi:N-methylhydantoinase A
MVRGMTRYRVGIDTGGTFTDVVAINQETGSIITTKTPSTPEDPAGALMIGLDKVLAKAGADRSALETLIHGTTVATNALLEERFGSVALVTTSGFRHILEIARQSVPSGYGNSYFWVKPDRIVPLNRVFEVSERLNYRGGVLKPLEEDGVHKVGRELARLGIEAAAVSLIHAYANGNHEVRVREILLEEHPSLVVSISSEVLPEYREYERTMTTCIDAYVKPVMARYIQRAISGLGFAEPVEQVDGADVAGGSAARGLNLETRNPKPETENAQRTTHNAQRITPFLIMQSNGGVLSATEVAKQPITTLLSGPAAGALGASYLAGLAGHDRVLTVDAGGTSTDICLVDSGVPHVTTQGTVGRFPVKLPMVDVTTIGTGGGSIAWIDPSGGLRVGPRSAGADPGPMCYGQGGADPTLTDANVALGRLPPELLGGEMKLDVDRAWAGLAELAPRLNLTAERLAAGIVEIADWNQVNAIRQVTVKKGLDPRSYAMVAFGGSGPLQAPHVAELLGIGTVVIPPEPGNVSAFGLLAVDLKTDYVATSVQREDRVDVEALNSAYTHLEDKAEFDLASEGVESSRRRFIRTADLRYFGEAYEVGVPAPSGVIDIAGLREMIVRFHRQHVRLYGYSYEGEQLCEIVNVRVTAVGLMDRPLVSPPASRESESPASSASSRHVWGDGHGAAEIPVFDRELLPAGHRTPGPCVIQEYGSTTVVPPGWSAEVDLRRNIVLRRHS